MQKSPCSPEEKQLLMILYYLDDSATTRVSEKAALKAAEMMTKNFGNPSSVYSLGLDAEREVKKARESVAKRLGCNENEIIFTSCGTEANNLALFGAADALKKTGKKIITTSIEHPSVLNAAKELEKRGFEVVFLPVYGDGKIKLDDLEKELDESVILVSIMLVNNETGAVQPVKEAASLTKRLCKNALFHCDMVQGFGKTGDTVKDLGVDLLSVSGHKVHAPKGVGALYVKNGVKINNILFGGGQEKGMRSGTENVPAIVAFGVAAEEIPDEKEALEKAKKLNETIRSRLLSIDGVTVNSPDDALPYIINLSLPKVPSEVMIHFLEQNGIFVSGGSACSKGRRSHVLTAQNLSPEIIDSAIRVSFSPDTPEEHLKLFAENVRYAARFLRRKK